jgi:hypothetical protein
MRIVYYVMYKKVTEMVPIHYWDLHTAQTSFQTHLSHSVWSSVTARHALAMHKLALSN